MQIAEEGDTAAGHGIAFLARVTFAGWLHLCWWKLIWKSQFSTAEM
jgi:hypothetical protein